MPDERRGPYDRRRDNRHPAVRRFRRVAAGSLICWAIVSTVGFVALIIQSNRNNAQSRQNDAALVKSSMSLGKATEALAASRAAVRDIQQSELRTCHRLNIVRASQNRNQLAAWRFDTLFVSLMKATVSSPRLSPAQRRATRTFVRALREEANARSWVPLTDCPKAVYTSTPAARPIPFSKMLPPHGALFLGPNN